MKKIKKLLCFMLAICLFSLVSFSLVSCDLNKNSNTTENNSETTYEMFLKAKESEGFSGSYLDFLKQIFSVSNGTSEKLSYSALSVVSVSAKATGSGVILDLDEDTGEAIIVTNYHVVYNEQENFNNITVRTYDGNHTVPATFVGWSHDVDIAVLKVEANNILQNYCKKAEIRDKKVSLLEKCYAIGNTANAGISATEGNISITDDVVFMNLKNKTGDKNAFHVIRHSAFINHGNSGGGLFDENGYFIGLTNGGVSAETQNSISLINYAVPANVVKWTVENILQNCLGSQNKEALIAKLGLTLKVQDSTIENDLTSGVIKKDICSIASIEESSLCSEKDVQENDIVKYVKINNKTYEINNDFELNEALLNSRLGDKIVLGLKRVDTNFEVVLTENLQDSYYKTYTSNGKYYL